MNLEDRRINKICPPSSGAIGNRLKMKRNKFSKAKKYNLSFLQILDMKKNKIKVKRLNIGPEIRIINSSCNDLENLEENTTYNVYAYVENDTKESNIESLKEKI